MKISIDGLIQEGGDIYTRNRGFKYGDSIFDTIRVKNNEPLFIEEHYFRMTSSMRIMRMNIPGRFTPSYLEEEINKVIRNNNESEITGIRISIYRAGGGKFTPERNDIRYVIEPYIKTEEVKEDDIYEIDIFKDYTVHSNLLSNIKISNKQINILGSIFTRENKLSNSLLINDKNRISEFTNANIFIIKGREVITPSLSEGCVKGIIRGKVIDLITKEEGITITEGQISQFDLLKSDEVFLTNVMTGIKSIDKYRSKYYEKTLTEEIRTKFKNIYTI